MRTSTRWTIATLAVVLALAGVFASELMQGPYRPGDPASAPSRRAHRDADTPEALAGPRQRADLPRCPTERGGAGPPPLRGVEVQCAADGSRIDLARALADRAVVLNMWAYWCGPCTDELPAMQDYQRRAGDAISVITVHQDENEAAALARMAELGVRLPVLQDGERRAAIALGLPNVMPVTVVIRKDGSVATVLPQPFTSADEIAAAVESALR